MWGSFFRDLLFERFLMHPLYERADRVSRQAIGAAIGLLINFQQPVLKNGIGRMILPGANQTEVNEGDEVSLT